MCFEGGGLGMQGEREGGRLPPPQVVLVFSRSLILALYRCYNMWVWSEGMEVLVAKGIAYDMAR